MPDMEVSAVQAFIGVKPVIVFLSFGSEVPVSHNCYVFFGLREGIES